LDKKKRRRRGTGCITKRGAIYWLYHSRRGTPQGESLGTSNRILAERLARKRIREIDDEEAFHRSILAKGTQFDFTGQPISSHDIVDESDEQILQRQKEEYERTNNPKLDEFWKMGDKLELDTGLYVDWCRRGNAVFDDSIKQHPYPSFRRIQVGVSLQQDYLLHFITPYPCLNTVTAGNRPSVMFSFHVFIRGRF